LEGRDGGFSTKTYISIYIGKRQKRRKSGKLKIRRISTSIKKKSQGGEERCVIEESEGEESGGGGSKEVPGTDGAAFPLQGKGGGALRLDQKHTVGKGKKRAKGIPRSSVQPSQVGEDKNRKEQKQKG